MSFNKWKIFNLIAIKFNGSPFNNQKVHLNIYLTITHRTMDYLLIVWILWINIA